jgi:hypothetical protein
MYFFSASYLPPGGCERLSRRHREGTDAMYSSHHSGTALNLSPELNFKRRAAMAYSSARPSATSGLEGSGREEGGRAGLRPSRGRAPVTAGSSEVWWREREV